MIIDVKGKVSSGSGTGKFFTSLSWVKSQVREKFGFEPYPGTLNILLEPQDAEKVSYIKIRCKDFIEPKEGYKRGMILKALINGSIEGAIVIPEVEGYKKNILEVIAPFYLREVLGLKDGDELEVKIYL